MTHEQLRESCGSYALGLLSDEERRAFETHLTECSECMLEIAEHSAVVSALAHAVPQVDPPPALRDRVLTAIAATAAIPASGALFPPAPARPRFALPTLLSAAALVAAVGLAVYSLSLRQRIEDLEEALRIASTRADAAQVQLAEYRATSDDAVRTRAILTARDLQRVDLAGQKTAPGASGRAFLSAAQGLVVAIDGLPAIAADRVYQLWVIPAGGAPISAALVDLQTDGRGFALAAASLLSSKATVAVTLEPAGGLPAPSGPIVIAGTAAN